MAHRNRETLKRYFRAGSLPSQEHFYDLVDSTLNMDDEGFRKSPENGLEITTIGTRTGLLSFYTAADPNTARWSVAYGGDTDLGGKQLVFSGRELLDNAPAPVMTLHPAGRVGIGTDRPRYTLDVDGTVRCTGRIGGYEPDEGTGNTGGAPGEKYEKSPVLADGEWHAITGELTGCQGFEIVAGVGESGKGRYAMLHAIALNTFNPPRGFLAWLGLRPRNKIRATEAYFSSGCDRLQLRWQGSSGRDAKYRLQIRTACAYAKETVIRYYVTRLWFDERMDGGMPPADATP